MAQRTRHPLTAMVPWRTVPAFLLVLAASAATAQFVPDDFHACALDTVWTLVDPAGDGATAAIVDAYTDEARLALSVPGGSAHEIWEAVIGAPHVLQPLADTDFTAEVKFTSALPANFAQEGLLVRQDDTRWLRLEFYRSETGQLRAAAVGGPSTVFFDEQLVVVPPVPLVMRVVRAGDTWTISRSADGVAWQAVGAPFAYDFQPDGIGIYAGNRGANPPAHTVQVDWIRLDAGSSDDTARNTLTAEVVGGGQVSRDPDRANYACGETVTVTAIDLPGWAFSGWSGALAGATNPAVVTMEGPLALTAHFATAPACTLTTTVAGGGSVSLSPPGGIYIPGTVVRVAAVDGPGWVFDAWTGDLAGQANPQDLVMDGDHAVTAVFRAVAQHVVTTSAAPAGAGAIGLDPPGGVYNPGTTVTFTAQPALGWVFASWWGDLTGAVNPAQLEVNGDLSVTAVFVHAPDRVLTTTSSAGGHVVRSPDLTRYPAGSSVELTAVPEPGFRFDGWSGDLSGSASPDTILMDTDKSVHATFVVPPLVFVSDDFNRCELGEPWVVVDPLGDGGGAALDGGYTGNAHVALGVMGGVAHEIWAGFIGATHILQPAPDSDFTVEVKFDSDLPGNFGQEGLLIRESQTRWVRAEFLRDDLDRLRAAVDLGPNLMVHDVLLPDGLAPPLWMRVTRTGDDFAQYWSADGATWNLVAGPVGYDLEVAAVGVYAGNRGTTPPAHTVLVDYFNNTAGPPALEDAGLASLTVVVEGSGTIVRELDLPSYACGQVERVAAVPHTGWHFDGWEGGATGTANPLSVTMSGPLALTARFGQGATAAPDVPAATRLHPCVPNPFNPQTVVTFDLARPGPVRLQVYGVDGLLVRDLADGRFEAGRHERIWDGRDGDGRRLGSGIYLVRLTTPEGARVTRVVMLK